MTAKGAAIAFFEKAEIYDGVDCLLWPFARVKGYAVMRVAGKTVYVCRRLMGSDAPPGKEVVAHRCGNGQNGCVTKRHLRWSTQKENVADTLAHGTRNRGARNGQAVITPEQALEIFKSRDKRATVAARYGVSEWTVKDIRSRRIWGWLTGE